MKFNFNDMPMEKKIIGIAMASASISLLLICSFFILFERYDSEAKMSAEMTALARNLEERARPPLLSDNEKTLRSFFATLQDNPDVLQAHLYDMRGNMLDSFFRSDFRGETQPPAPTIDGITTSDNSMKLFRIIRSKGERIGALCLEYDMSDMYSRLDVYWIVTFFVWGLSLLASFLVATHLKEYVVQSLRQVMKRMQEIAQGEGDLSSRLEVHGKDEIGEVAEAFNVFVGKLESVQDMKLDLISVVSHQLKTPVAEINGFIENLLEGLIGELNPRQKRYLEEMRSIGTENYRLICGLLSASKIDRGVVSVDLKPVSPQEVVGLSIRDYEEPLRQKGLNLRLEGMEEEIRFYADHDKMVEALRNLLNNAIKCTDKGMVTVRIGSEGDQGLIEVKDTGIGMDAATMERLFTKSRVLGKEAHRSGAGLGLYISKHFMKLQNGDILVSSEVGKGSCFKLLVPKLREREGAVA